MRALIGRPVRIDAGPLAGRRGEIIAGAGDQAVLLTLDPVPGAAADFGPALVALEDLTVLPLETSCPPPAPRA